jgi:hypothetical protein
MKITRGTGPIPRQIMGMGMERTDMDMGQRDRVSDRSNDMCQHTHPVVVQEEEEEVQ